MRNVASTIAKRLSYANITATLALFLVLGGGAYAAVTLPANSVGTVQLKDNAVTSRKVLDGSLLRVDFRAGQLPQGPQGPAGPPGPQGPQGPQGPPGTGGGVSGLEVVYAASGAGAATSKSSEALCPASKKVSGGGHLIAGGATNARVTVSTPGQVANPTSWYVEAKEPSATGVSWTLYAYAVCVSVTS